jgi:hypothetical protein
MKNKTHTINGEEWEEVSWEEWRRTNGENCRILKYNEEEIVENTIYLIKKKKNVFEDETYKIIVEDDGIKVVEKPSDNFFYFEDSLPLLKEAVDRAMEIIEEKKQ